nr:hypothetical protein [Tanacetum cinerariifolium]
MIGVTLILVKIAATTGNPEDHDGSQLCEANRIDAGVPDEGQTGPNTGDQDEGQAGPNPSEQDECQAGTNPGDAAAFCKRQGITALKPQDLEGPAFKLVKVFPPNVIHFQYQIEECHKLLSDSVDDFIIRHNVSKPLPLGGPPGQVTIQSDFFFNKDLEYLRYGSKGSRPALLILKMNAAYYPDVGLEQMVPAQMWIEEECEYDIAAIAVRTHMWILSVVRIKVFSMYGYDYMKKIVLRRADLSEHIIAKRDFKYLYPSDFEDLQRVEDFQLGIESYQTQLNLTKPRWDATGFEYKHDYTVIDSPKAVTFWDRNGIPMIMRFNEIHKLSDGTLHQINEALDYLACLEQDPDDNSGRRARFVVPGFGSIVVAMLVVPFLADSVLDFFVGMVETIASVIYSMMLHDTKVCNKYNDVLYIHNGYAHGCAALQDRVGGWEWTDIMALYCQNSAKEDSEFARRMGVLLQEMVAAYDERVDLIWELEAMSGVAVAVKTADFLNDALWKEDRRLQSEDLRLAREINALCARVTIIVDERENFVDELDVLVGRSVPDKMAEFIKQVHGKDIPNLMKLQILKRKFELRAQEKGIFIEKLKGNLDF